MANPLFLSMTLRLFLIRYGGQGHLDLRRDNRGEFLLSGAEGNPFWDVKRLWDGGRRAMLDLGHVKEQPTFSLFTPICFYVIET
jgi:hypothetical protein